MTKEQLKNYDGKEGRPAYFAYKGKIYDVTESRLWKNGTHMRRHEAGADLTEALAAAPHADDVMSRFPCVGELEPDEMPTRSNMERLQDIYALLHPHPMVIHLPMGLYMFAPVMYLMYIITGTPSFEAAAFYCTVGATLGMFPSMATGFFSWWVNYDMGMNKFFKAKIIFSIVLTVVSTVMSILRYNDPFLFLTPSIGAAFYQVMLFLNVPLLGIIGYNGGKITWTR